jgi:polysaccharide deacetylase 2 family uncharacterized protein YibQ
LAAARRTSRSRQKKNPPDHRWPLVLGGLVIVAIIGVSALMWARTDRGQAALLQVGADALFGDVQARVDSVCVAAWPAFEPGPLAAQTDADAHDWPLPGQDPPAAIRCRVVPITGQDAWWQVQARVAQRLRSVGARVVWGERLPRPSRRGRGGDEPDERRDLLRLDLGVTGRATHTVILYRQGTDRPEVRWGGDPASSAWRQLAGDGTAPLVAIVIDDWGYRSDATTSGLVALDVPLTMAVLPHLAYSRKFALEGTDLVLPGAAGDRDLEQAARRRQELGAPVTVGLGREPGRVPARRREIMLHLPMESIRYPDVDPGPGAILVGMAASEIAATVEHALASLPNVRGVNNHQGSAATADGATMQAVMRVLRAHDLFFLDSLTSSSSVAYAEAQAAGIAAARNRIFLDADHEDSSRIRERLQRLVRAARATGAAIGIGHPHPATLEVLAAEIPRYAAEGVRFVTMSELLALTVAAGAEDAS